MANLGGMVLDPATFATLQSTLGPAGALSILQAQQVEQQKQLQQATTQATKQAQQAGQAYQQAAAEPSPELSQLDQFLPQLMGGIASVVARDPSFRQRADEDIKQQRRSLLQNRLDNLAALKESWDKKAAIAEHANDLEQTIKARQSSEQLSKLMDQLNEAASNKARLEQIGKQGENQIAAIRAQGEEARKTEKVKQESAQADYFDELIHDAPEGEGQYLDLTNVPNNYKLKSAALSHAKSKGIPALSKDDANSVAVAGTVIEDMKAIDKVMSTFLTDKMGLAALPQAGRNLGAAFLKSNVDIASFGPTREAAIRTLTALVGGHGTGFRMTQPEVDLMLQNWPQITDPLPVARGKLNWDKTFMMNKVRSALGKKPLPIRSPKIYEKLPAGANVREDGKVRIESRTNGRRGWAFPDDPDFKSLKVVTDGS